VPVRLLLKDPFDARSRISGIAAPVLFVHGEADRIVPIRFGQALYQAARDPREAHWIAGGGHDDLLSFGLFDIAFGFIDRTPGLPRRAQPEPVARG